jgi:Holliday junction resolvase RusA-like endonuclease
MNRYWRSVNGRVLIAAAGRRYRTDVELAYRLQSITGGGAGSLPVEISIDAWLPDLRRRDIDNLLKAPLDALTHAGLWDDDSQVMALAIRKAGMDRVRPRLEIAIDIDSPPAANQGNRHVR